MKLVYLLISTLLLTAFMSPSTGHALVRELANCTTSNGQYAVTIIDNEGIGPIRTPHPVAEITNAQLQVVASYAVEVYRGPQSVSFGRPTYMDSQTKGHDFTLAGPSTNFHNYVLRAVLNSGLETVISDNNLNCSVFSILQ